jgi:archaellum biogenesis ATPase FlaH
MSLPELHARTNTNLTGKEAEIESCNSCQHGLCPKFVWKNLTYVESNVDKAGIAKSKINHAIPMISNYATCMRRAVCI